MSLEIENDFDELLTITNKNGCGIKFYPPESVKQTATGGGGKTDLSVIVVCYLNTVMYYIDNKVNGYTYTYCVAAVYYYNITTYIYTKAKLLFITTVLDLK